MWYLADATQITCRSETNFNKKRKKLYLEWWVILKQQVKEAKKKKAYLVRDRF